MNLTPQKDNQHNDKNNDSVVSSNSEIVDYKTSRIRKKRLRSITAKNTDLIEEDTENSYGL